MRKDFGLCFITAVMVFISILLVFGCGAASVEWYYCKIRTLTLIKWYLGTFLELGCAYIILSADWGR